MKNLVAYKLEMPVTVSAEQLQTKLFRECGSHDRSTQGFHPTLNGELVYTTLTGDVVLSFATQKKKPKTSEVNRRLELLTVEHETNFGSAPSKEEIAEMKESIIDELLPVTFADEIKLAIVVITDNMVYVEGNYKQAEVITATLRECLGSLPIEVINPAEDVSDTLTRFVGDAINDKLVLMDKCKLETAEERKITVEKNLYGSEAIDLVAEGAKVINVQLEYDGILSFIVKDDLSISGIKVYSELIDEFEEDEIEAKFEKELIEIKKMFDELLAEMGGIDAAN